jgi:hypothetical protein
LCINCTGKKSALEEQLNSIIATRSTQSDEDTDNEQVLLGRGQRKRKSLRDDELVLEDHDDNPKAVAKVRNYGSALGPNYLPKIF